MAVDNIARGKSKKDAIKYAQEYVSIGVTGATGTVDGVIWTLAGGAQINMPIANWHNMTKREQEILALAITNGSGALAWCNDGKYHVLNQTQTNDNKRFTFTADQWVLNSDGNYTLDYKHGLNCLNIIPIVRNSNDEEEFCGKKELDSDNIRFTSERVFSGYFIANYSVSSGDKINNIPAVRSEYTFNTIAERDAYFALSYSVLQDGLVVIVNQPSKSLYIYTGTDNPTSYDSTLWTDGIMLLRGEKGNKGVSISDIVDNGDTFTVKLDSGVNFNLTKVSTLASKVNIDKTNLTDILSKFTGTTVQDVIEFIDKNHELKDGLIIGDKTTDGSSKLISKGSKLILQRLENGIWVDTTGSVTTDIVNLNKDYSSINFEQASRDLNIIKLTTDGNSEQIGDIRLSNMLLTGKEINHIKLHDSTTYGYVLQPNFDVEQSITTCSTTFTIPDKNGLIYPVIYGLEVWNTTIDKTKFEIKDISTNNIIYSSCTDFELKQGLGQQLAQSGKHTEMLRKLIYLASNRQYTVTFTSQNPVSFMGGLVGGVFAPYMVIKYYMAESNRILDKTDIIDGLTSNLSDKALSARQGKILNDSIRASISGKSVPVFISVADFNALTTGNLADTYILTDSGLLKGRESEGMYYKDSTIIITNSFTDTPIVKEDYTVNNSGGSANNDILFIINITTSDIGKNVNTTYNASPANESIQNIVTDAKNLIVTVLWTFDKDNICPVPSVNGVNVSNITTRIGNTYSGSVLIDITEATDITATLNNTSYKVGLTKVVPPIIQSITFGSLPNLQTELKENDNVNIILNVDKPINKVEVQDFGAFKYGSYAVTSGTSVTVSGTIANKGNTLQQLPCRIRVQSTDGSWSTILESTNTLPLNNVKPTISLATKTFSSGFSALKNSETCDVKVSVVNCDTLVSSAIGADLNVGAMVGNDCTVTRINGSYNDSVANLRITGMRTANNSTNYLDICVEIANVAASLTNASTVPKVRTGETQPILCTFDQKVSVTACSIVTPNKGALTTGTLPTSLNYNFSPNISVTDTDTHSNNNLTMTVTVTNMSGQQSVISKYYIIRGFQQKTINVVYPAITATIPTIVNQNNVIISGQITSTPPYTICTTYNNPTSVITDYNFNGVTLNLPPLGVLSGFYYSSLSPIIITIEEIA